MDDIVRQAMRKWPGVPACNGWLALDARGHWRMRDAAAQASGAFQHARGRHPARGVVLQHAGLVQFIGRNYQAAPDGRWYFQNGPQRVYVELECTPWIWRLHQGSGGLRLEAHTGQAHDAHAVRSSLMDEDGHLYLLLPAGLGRVHGQDLLTAAEALDNARLPACAPVRRADLPQRFGFVPSPEHSAQKESPPWN